MENHHVSWENSLFLWIFLFPFCPCYGQLWSYGFAKDGLVAWNHWIKFTNFSVMKCGPHDVLPHFMIFHDISWQFRTEILIVLSFLWIVPAGSIHGFWGPLLENMINNTGCIMEAGFPTIIHYWEVGTLKELSCKLQTALAQEQRTWFLYKSWVLCITLFLCKTVFCVNHGFHAKHGFSRKTQFYVNHGLSLNKSLSV